MIDMLKGEGTVREEFPGKHILFRRFGIDISKQPMLIFPTLHYQNGGLQVTSRSETNVPGLFAAGEVTGGIHGENRLMGNSLLDVIVFGRIAGTHAAQYVGRHQDAGRYNLDHVKKYHRELQEAGIGTSRIAPMILPDYTNPDIHDRQLTTEYFGTLM
jgi:succinate dehydrogenase/fumarate reductase flavoprotein subunit